MKKYEMIEKIEELEYQVKKLSRIIKLHKLDEIPIKYRKAFPKDDEEELFIIDKFKSKNIPNSLKVFELGYGFPDLAEEIEFPKDPKVLQTSKERMRRRAEKVNKEMTNGRWNHKEPFNLLDELLKMEFMEEPKLPT